MDQDEIDLSRLVGLFWKRKFLAVGLVIPFAVLGALYAFLVTPQYETEAKVLFEPSGSVLSGSEFSRENPLSRMESEIQIARSEGIVLSVIRDLNLVTDARLDRRGRSQDAILDQLTGSEINQQDAAQSVERIRRFVERSVNVRQVGRSTLLSFVAETAYPELSADLANAFSENYIRAQIQSKVRSAIDSLAVVDAAVQEAGEGLEDSQKALSAYLIDNAQEISFQAGNVDIALLADDLEQTQASVNQLVQNRERLAALVAANQFDALESEFAVSTSDDILLELQAQAYFDLENRRRQLLSAREENPTSQDIADQLGAIEGEIASLANDRLEQLVEETAVQQEKQASIKGQLEVEIFSADLPPEIASDLFKLQSDASSAREQYVSLVDRADELAVQTRTQVADSRIVARANVPLDRSSPNRPRLIALAAVLGIVFSLGVIVASDFIWGGLQSTDEVRSVLGLNRAAVIGKIQDKGDIAAFILNDPFGTYSESLRMVRSEIQKSILTRENAYEEAGISLETKGGGELICVTSTVPKEGKSTTSIGLTVLASMSGQKACLIDLDVRRPSVHGYMGLEQNPDLANYLSGHSSDLMIQGYDVPIGNGSLDVIAGATGGYINPDEAIGSGKLKALLDDLKHQYDLIVIDTAPVLAVAETQTIATYCDATVFCVREDYAPRRAVIEAVRSLTTSLKKHFEPVVAFSFSQSRRGNHYYAYRSYANRD